MKKHLSLFLPRCAICTLAGPGDLPEPSEGGGSNSMQEGSWASWRSVDGYCPQHPTALPMNKHVLPSGLGVTTQQRPDSLAPGPARLSRCRADSRCTREPC